MAKISDYIVDGVAQRSKIAMDVANGSISGAEIKGICSNKIVKDAFIGSKYANKVNSDEWDREYLDEVICAAVAENFNEDYLMYLSEVGYFVRNKKSSSITTKTIIGIVAVVAIVAVIIGVVVWKMHNVGQ